jgi:flagellar biosynthesis/type III secretory pathway protein FliH
MGRLVRAAGRVVPAELLSAREQAGRLIAEAEAARGEAERRGYQDGHAAGREAGLAEVTATLAAAEAHAEEVRARAAEPALRLARRMAEKIIGRAVELDPVVMADIVGRALAAARAGDAAAVLRVHPDDLTAAQARRLPASIRLLADPAVGRAGCVVDTAAGRVDARLSTQLDALERAVRGSG